MVHLKKKADVWLLDRQIDDDSIGNVLNTPSAGFLNCYIDIVFDEDELIHTDLSRLNKRFYIYNFDTPKTYYGKTIWAYGFYGD